MSTATATTTVEGLDYALIDAQHYVHHSALGLCVLGEWRTTYGTTVYRWMPLNRIGVTA